MKAKKNKTYSVTRENSRTGRSVTKTRSADGTKTKSVSKSPISLNKVGQKKSVTKTKSADGSKSKTTTRTVGQHYLTGKGSRRYLAGAEITKKKTKSADGSRSKSKEIKNPMYTSESKKRIKKLGLESEYTMERGGKVKKTVYGSMKEGGKMYRNGGRRKKQSIPRSDRTDIKLTGRKRAEAYRSRRIREAMNKQAAMDKQNEQDGGDRKLGDPGTGTSGTLNLVSQDPKKQAKLLRMNARVDAKSDRAINRAKRRKNKPVVKKLTKGLEARRKRKRVRMYDKMKDLRVMDKDRFIRHMREDEPTSFSPKDPTSMRKRTRRTK